MNSTPINVIRATADDIETAAPLFDAYRQFYGQASDIEGAKKFLAERLRLEQSAIFLAILDGTGCGFTQLYPAFSSVALRPIWILNDLFVAPEARRMGVGKSLLRAATEHAAKSGAKRLALSTAADNREAQSLYEQTGWVRDDAFIHYNFEL